jgi:hypothetical protein
MNDHPHKRRFRYGLRTLLALITLVAVVLALLPLKARLYHERKARVQKLVESLGGTVTVVGKSQSPSAGANWLSVRLGYVEPNETLWEVILAGKRITDEVLWELGDCPWIRAIDLSDTKANNAALEHIARIDWLRVLKLRNTKVTDIGLRHLERLKWLTTLDVVGTAATYDGLARLDAALPEAYFQRQLAQSRLENGPINLSGRGRGGLGTPDMPTGPPGDGYYAPAHMWMHTARIWPDRKLTPQEVEDLRRLISLSGLDVDAAAFPPGNFASAVANLTGLWSISINETKASVLVDGGLVAIGKLPRVHALTVQNARLSDRDFAALANAKALEVLSINGSSTLTPGLLAHLRLHPRLRSISLNVGYDAEAKRPWEDALIAAKSGMEQLATMPNLESLQLYGPFFTDEVVAPVTYIQSLKGLSLYGTPCSAEMVEKLQQALPNCQIRRIPSE